jgi:hypothetical protein
MSWIKRFCTDKVRILPQQGKTILRIKADMRGSEGVALPGAFEHRGEYKKHAETESHKTGKGRVVGQRGRVRQGACVFDEAKTYKSSSQQMLRCAFAALLLLAQHADALNVYGRQPIGAKVNKGSLYRAASRPTPLPHHLLPISRVGRNEGMLRQSTSLYTKNHDLDALNDVESENEKLALLEPESSVEADVSGPSLTVPTRRQLCLFGLPTLGTWLLGPIMSLIDSSVVGLSGTVPELAALGPGISLCDSSSYILTFITVATTNLFATALASRDKEECKRIVSDALTIGLGLGILLGVFQYLSAPFFMRQLCGTAVSSIPYAISYVRIRSLAAPSVLLTMVMSFLLYSTMLILGSVLFCSLFCFIFHLQVSFVLFSICSIYYSPSLLLHLL